MVVLCQHRRLPTKYDPSCHRPAIVHFYVSVVLFPCKSFAAYTARSFSITGGSKARFAARWCWLLRLLEGAATACCSGGVVRKRCYLSHCRCTLFILVRGDCSRFTPLSLSMVALLMALLAFLGNT